MDRRRRSRSDLVDLIVKITAELAAAGLAVAQTIDIISHVHW